MANSDLVQRIHSLDKLTPSETKIADYMCQFYPEVAFENVTSIAKKVGVSKATVVRFIQRMGYTSYTHFHDSVRTDIMHEFTSPAQRFSLMQQQLLEEGQDLLSQNFSLIIKNLQHTHDKIDHAVFMKVARILADGDNHLYIMGQRASFGLAYQAYAMLGYLRSHITLLDMPSAMMPTVLAELGPDDVLFAISFRRYARTTYRVARHFAVSGGRVILMADSEFSPLKEFAELQLVVPSDGLAVFHSRCAATALLESLVIAAMKFHDEHSNGRTQAIQALFNDLEVYYPGRGTC